MKDLIQANLILLDQMTDLLRQLDAETYIKKSPVFLNSAIGGHVRHCLEHYQSLFSGLPSGHVNYDLRARDVQVENLPVAALERVDDLRLSFTKLDSLAMPIELTVQMDHGAMSEGTKSQKSSFGRELQFIISHTIHHFAIIAGLCRVHGIAIADDFGVASSTLRHRCSLSQ